MAQEQAPQCRAEWWQFLTEAKILGCPPDCCQERGVSVDGESVPQPDGRVRQGGRGQARRGRQGRGLQSYVPAGHNLDFLKSKTRYDVS